MIYTNFNFNNFNKKENANKFILFGILLLILGTSALIFRNIGIRIVSYTIGASLLFFAYLNLKNINELRRYQSKEDIKPYTRIQWILIVASLLLIIFPEKVQALFSSIAGAYLLAKTLIGFIKYRNIPGYTFSTTKVLSVILGLVLIISPLFLSSFIASILSLIIVLIAFFLISSGNNLKKNNY